MIKKTIIHYSSFFLKKIIFSCVGVSIFISFSTTELSAQIVDEDYKKAQEISKKALQLETKNEKKKPLPANKNQIIAKGKSVQLNQKRLKKIITALTKKMQKSFYKNLKCKEKYYSKNTKINRSCFNFPTRILMTTLNIYGENIKNEDMKFFQKALVDIDIPKYKFEIRKSRSTFQIRQIVGKNNFRIIRGPINNVELTKFVLKEGFEYYGEFYLYISPRRVVLEIYVFDGVTHQLKWSDWQSIGYSPIYLNFTTGIRINFSINNPTFTMLHTDTGFHIPDFGSLGLYFDFGFSSSKNPVGSPVDNINVGVAIGGLLSFNMVEMITKKKHPSDFVITFGPGMFFKIPIIDQQLAPDETTTTTTTNGEGGETAPATQTNSSVSADLIIPIGITVPIENFSISVDYEPMKKMIGMGFNYKF